MLIIVAMLLIPVVISLLRAGLQRTVEGWCYHTAGTPLGLLVVYIHGPRECNPGIWEWEKQLYLQMPC